MGIAHLPGHLQAKVWLGRDSRALPRHMLRSATFLGKPLLNHWGDCIWLVRPTNVSIR